MGPGVLGSRGQPVSLAPIAEANLLLISVSEYIGFAREFGEHSVQPAEVVVKLLFQILLAGVRTLQVAQVHQDVFGLPGAAFFTPRWRWRLVQDPPLDVVADGLEQHVVAIHVPGGREKAAVGAARAWGWGRALLQTATTAAYLHANIVVQPGLGQGHVTQQAGHHHRLVHVVHRADEAVHGIKERVLLVVGVADLHHGGRASAEAQGHEMAGWDEGVPAFTSSRMPARGAWLKPEGGIPGSSSDLSNFSRSQPSSEGCQASPGFAVQKLAMASAWSVGRVLIWVGEQNE